MIALYNGVPKNRHIRISLDIEDPNTEVSLLFNPVIYDGVLTMRISIFDETSHYKGEVVLPMDDLRAFVDMCKTTHWLNESGTRNNG